MEKRRKSYRIAGVPFDLYIRSAYLEKLCADYEVDVLEDPEFVTEVSDADIMAEREKGEGEMSEPIYESLAVYRNLCEKMLEYDSFLFHGSAVAVDGKAYLFTAPSGTGKSTHTRMWRQHFGDRTVMVNDDKPLLQVREDGIYVCGTPWCGKHGLQTNCMMPLQGICILRRGEENEIHAISPIDGYIDLYRQSYRPKDKEKMIKTLALIRQLAERVPLYEMHCTISEEAAVMAWNKMKDQDRKSDEKSDRK